VGSDSADFVVHLLGLAAFLWSGLYILTRGKGGSLARLTALAALSTAALFGFGGLLEAVDPRSLTLLRAIDRISWWSAVAPAAVWLHLSVRLQPNQAGERRHQLVQATYAVAAVLIVLGTFTNLVRDYTPPGALDRAGPLYIVFAVYLLGCAGLASLNLIRVAGASRGSIGDRAAMRRLAGGSLCFLIGAAFFSVQKLQDNNGDNPVPWLLLLLGVGAMTGAIGIQSSLLLGTDVRRDFLYNATSLLLLVVPYLAISTLLVGFADSPPRLLALAATALITAGYTLYDKGREWLDAAFFAPPLREARAAGRAYVEALATQPVGPGPELATLKSFDDAVRRALTHLSDPTKLAISPLLNLRSVARGLQEQGLEENRLNRAAVLKEMLIELLSALKPAAGSGGVISEASRFYNCLYFPYVRGVSRRRAPTILRQLQERRRLDGGAPTDTERVVQWLLQVDEDTFYKWQRRGSDAMAAALREREVVSGGSVPV
jgi:hypothetical protein